MSAFADTRLKGPWSGDQVAAFLAEERSPLRLAINSTGGFPLVVSLWFRADGDSLWCATHETALVAKRLGGDGRVGFEVSVNDPPYVGVRGQGRVELLGEEGRPQLEALIDRYLGDRDSDLAQWLLSRADGELALRIRPEWMVSWDFRDRMDEAVDH